ncbi:DNA polymerase III subunit gamma/tau [Salinisphaera sp. LB1]|uniref:DNA polymerase III subunit gamma/tau n=1 Tax=Salinisphaera sp. LB1 TaxID=2183911 RepID=UPI000D7056CB|nr:DNA polymerase III subunit gamma/tau [Salinisphaera sp. LB1]AWN17541.1 DNA polymerase III subunits gamma and tau [Salinisphaera sp. LB1]
MSFQALARTWRPRRFDQLVGQEHVVRALTHALDGDKLHHALLFSGTRGVGKTTLARIIAKCLNCERGVSASPCVGEEACATCREIDEGRYVDLIEVDAASRTGVDDTRDLMDNVQYAPTRGRTKVYLIDEVHMLTKHSFNALLKTLEEPPPRVQFLLATTEPEKIPVTILSRCLQFPLKRLSATRIADRLRHIVDAESLSADEEALAELARGADGSMRDGLSLLDQAVAFGGGHLDVDGVRDMLGTIGEARVAELIDAVIDAQATVALIALESLYAQGIDMRYLLEAIATAWQHIATVQVVGEAIDDESARWQASADRLDPRVTQLFYDITVAGIRDLPNAPDPLVGVKMSVLRMLAFAPVGSDNPVPASTSSPAPASRGPQAPEQGAPAGRKLSAREAMARARAQLQGKKDGGSDESTATPAEQVATPDAAGPAVAVSEPLAQAPADIAPTVAERPAAITEQSGPAAQEPATPDPANRAAAEVPTPAPDATASTDRESTGGAHQQQGAPAVAETHVSSAQSQPEAGRQTTDEAAVAAVATPEQRPLDPGVAAVDSSRTAGAAEENTGHAPEATGDTFDFASTRDHPEDWHALVPRLDIRGFAAQLASNGVCRHLDNTLIELELARANAFLATEDARERLQSALADAWGTAAPPHLKINVVDELHDTPAKRIEANAEKRQQDAVASIENDPIIQQLRSQLGARLRPETIKPHRSPGAMQQRDNQ